jgi:hypothetical protein
MRKTGLTSILFFILVMGTLMLLSFKDAYALPSFARQTGMECTACHTIWPELKPFGRFFKLNGYVQSKSTKSYEFPPPIAGGAQLSFTHLDKALPHDFINSNWATHTMSSGNDIMSLPQIFTIYYGGRIFGRIGAFIQGTYDGTDNSFMLDMTDIRYANSTSLFGKNLVYGVTVNNSPTLQDVWNSTPSFSFPYAVSSVAPIPAATTIIAGTLDQQVGGLGLYGFWNNLVYGGVAVYRTTEHGITKPLGAGTSDDMVVDNAAPYWRLVLQHQWGEHYLSVGTYGMTAKIYPENRRSGQTDRFTDAAFDAQYQYFGKNHTISAHTTWIHENQDRDASFVLGEAANRSDYLDQFMIHGHYYYNSGLGTLGASLGFFSTTGSRDRFLYSPGQIDGSSTGKPDSNGFILEADYLPLKSLKVSLQYIIYDKFNGSQSNYDGFGRDASDNNTLYALIWLML